MIPLLKLRIRDGLLTNLSSTYFFISSFFDVILVLCKVTELSPEETESITGGYGKSISHVIIGLKTVKGTKQLKLDPTIYDALIKEKVWFCCYTFLFLKGHAFLFFNFLFYMFIWAGTRKLFSS